MLLFSHGSFLWAADLVRLLLFYEKVHRERVDDNCNESSVEMLQGTV